MENLRYLNTEQALADWAHFITEMNKEYQLPADVKWVVFGGSFAGKYAAWMRLKYPNLIHGAVSSSAPLLAQVNFPEFIDELRTSLNTTVHGSACPAAVKAANKQVTEMLQSEVGRQQIKSLFNLCAEVSTQNDDYNLRQLLVFYLSSAIRTDKHISKYPVKTAIDSVCDILTNQSIGDPLHRFEALETIINGIKSPGCMMIEYEDYVKVHGVLNTTNTLLASMRLTMYQACTEFGHFLTSENHTSLFGNSLPLEFNMNLCRDVFGLTKEEVFQGVDRTNVLYGGLELKATRVVYINGDIDPWRALSIVSTKIPESPAILIEGAGHNAFMNPPKDTDVPALTAARLRVGKLIAQWLREE